MHIRFWNQTQNLMLIMLFISRYKLLLFAVRATGSLARLVETTIINEAPTRGANAITLMNTAAYRNADFPIICVAFLRAINSIRTIAVSANQLMASG